MGQKQNTLKGYNSQKMNKLLKECISTTMEIKYPPISYKRNYNEHSMEEDSTANEGKESDFESEEKEDKEEFFFGKCNTFTDKNLLVKKIYDYPYSCFGILKVKFPQSEEIFENICFVIDENIIVTLASNLYNKDKGGKSLYVMTSFTGEKQIKWDNIHIQPNKENNNYKSNITKNKKKNEDIIEEKDLKNKLAVIIHKNVKTEWFGVELLEKNKLEENYYYYSIILIGTKKNEKKDNDNINIKEEPILGRIIMDSENPFLKIYNAGTPEDKEILKKNSGNPIYRDLYNDGFEILGIINEQYEFQFFDKETYVFLQSEIRNIKTNKEGISMDRIEKLSLSNKDLGPLDILYLSEFDLKNLKVIDLSGNSIMARGARFLCYCSIVNVEILNLNFNEIGDEGVDRLSHVNFNKLKQLHLFYNKLSFRAVEYLSSAIFLKTLEILSLSENPNIRDQGPTIIGFNDNFKNLKILHMNSTGLTDNGLKELNLAYLPMLEILNIQGNNFTNEGIKIIEEMENKKIRVKYKIEK